ncbi:uncharacterized protein SCHCODRAFT_02131645 [Schizophyllum commune H4-8]|uniref:uncharacterized protein n=1 Tax=Schizophyllum commune (strain H4-8 / FGSC 9210) TaxID=578458 RepID=UPI00215FC406|nr:uncharacterized protein SCHCODRAFT_02131645 [Schizophyllum commune H4-8]KAI5885124.1 hypothetical protein SCHCODRAFT_02131645 [Schizophyllum commune H4-8]
MSNKDHCEECDKWFERKNMPRHRRTHSSQQTERFRCDTCQKTFTRQDNLRQHKLRHGGKNIHCEVEGCFAAFKTPNDLSHHRKEKHPEVAAERRSSSARRGRRTSAKTSTPTTPSTPVTPGADSPIASSSSAGSPRSPGVRSPHCPQSAAGYLPYNEGVNSTFGGTNQASGSHYAPQVPHGPFAPAGTASWYSSGQPTTAIAPYAQFNGPFVHAYGTNIAPYPGEVASPQPQYPPGTVPQMASSASAGPVNRQGYQQHANAIPYAAPIPSFAEYTSRSGHHGQNHPLPPYEYTEYPGAPRR